MLCQHCDTKDLQNFTACKNIPVYSSPITSYLQKLEGGSGIFPNSLVLLVTIINKNCGVYHLTEHRDNLYK